MYILVYQKYVHSYIGVIIIQSCIFITYTGHMAHSDIELKQDFYNVIVLRD